MAVVLRYVDGCGVVKERFVGVVHVKDTYALTLISAMDSLFAEHNVSLKQVRGQGYDGASNMRGVFNGLKALILRDNSSAYYVHCFAHQLQLVVVVVAKHHDGVGDFFDKLALVVNVVSASCKRKDMIREAHKDRIEKEIANGEVETGTGKNQELSLVRAGDKRWGSHHKTMSSLKSLFSEVVMVLEYVKKDGDNTLCRRQASGILAYFDTFDFGAQILSRALQRKDQNILEAVSLVQGTKMSLQNFRENGFDGLLDDVNTFCQKYDLERLNMDEVYVVSRNRKRDITNQQYFKVEIFNTVLDKIIQEFNDRFSEVSTELLTNMAALSPRNSFSMFDASKLLKLSEMYPMDFNQGERDHLKRELDIYYEVVLRDDRFCKLKGIAELARLMVETEKHLSYRHVYRLLKLALVLPVATATVERCFSAMKHVKSYLRNRMNDEFLNGCLLGAIEREALAGVKDEAIMNRFQRMKDRRVQLC